VFQGKKKPTACVGLNVSAIQMESPKHERRYRRVEHDDASEIFMAIAAEVRTACV
jgi:hypothetical protein